MSNWLSKWAQTLTHYSLMIVLAILAAVVANNVVVGIVFLLAVLANEISNMSIKADEHAVWQATRANFGWYVVVFFGVVIIGGMVASGALAVYEIGDSLNQTIQESDIHIVLPEWEVIAAILLFIVLLLMGRGLVWFINRLSKPATPPAGTTHVTTP